MKSIGVGLIGSGFMGKSHALAWNAVRPVFGDVPDIRLVHLGEMNEELAQAKAAEFGFEKAIRRLAQGHRRPRGRRRVDHHAEQVPPGDDDRSTCRRQARLVRKADGAQPARRRKDAGRGAGFRQGRRARLQLHPEPGHPPHRQADRRRRDRAGQPCPHRDGRGLLGRSGSAVPAAPRGRQRLWRDRRFRGASAVAGAHAVRRHRARDVRHGQALSDRARRRRASARSRSTTSPRS